MPTEQQRRVVTYVDGFNLYFGLRDSGMRGYLWLDLPKLASSLLLPDQSLRTTKYFTSLISSPKGKRLRQSSYIDALTTHCGNAIRFYYGKYETQERVCRKCSASEMVPSEKKTDVNIAVELMVDAFQNEFDTAILVSADSDLVPPISAIRHLFPEKRVVVAFPPGRHSSELKEVAHASLQVGRAKFAAAQLPETICKRNGTVLSRPPKWTRESDSQSSHA